MGFNTGVFRFLARAVSIAAVIGVGFVAFSIYNYKVREKEFAEFESQQNKNFNSPEYLRQASAHEVKYACSKQYDRNIQEFMQSTETTRSKAYNRSPACREVLRRSNEEEFNE